MKRLVRWFVNGSTLLLIVACVAVAALCARSCSVHDAVTIQNGMPDQTDRLFLWISSGRGHLGCITGSLQGCSVIQLGGGRRIVRFGPRRQWTRGTAELPAGPDPISPFSLKAFGFHRIDPRTAPDIFALTYDAYLSTGTVCSLRLPHWALIAALLVWPIALGAARVIGRMRGRRRAARGLCVKCGYDLRASSGRCPECGAPDFEIGAAAVLGPRPPPGRKVRTAVLAAGGLLVVLLPVAWAAARARHAREIKARYQQWADQVPWEWSDEQATLRYSISQAPDDYQVVHLAHADVWDDTIQILRAGKQVYLFKGHGQTVFVRKGETLVYAAYSPMSCGCTLVAVDLPTGEELWESDLLGVGACAHSKYDNSVRLRLSGDAVEVWGNESLGTYVEVVNLDSGETLAHHVFSSRRSRP